MAKPRELGNLEHRPLDRRFFNQLAGREMVGFSPRRLDRSLLLRFEKEFGIGSTDGKYTVPSGPSWLGDLAIDVLPSDPANRLCTNRKTARATGSVSPAQLSELLDSFTVLGTNWKLKRS